MSQRELAQKSGTQPSQVNRYEHDTAQPTALALKRLVSALGVTADWLLFDEVQGDRHAQIQDPEILRLASQVDALSDETKAVAKAVLDALVKREKIATLASERTAGPVAPSGRQRRRTATTT